MAHPAVLDPNENLSRAELTDLHIIDDLQWCPSGFEQCGAHGAPPQIDGQIRGHYDRSRPRPLAVAGAMAGPH